MCVCVRASPSLSLSVRVCARVFVSTINLLYDNSAVCVIISLCVPAYSMCVRGLWYSSAVCVIMLFIRQQLNTDSTLQYVYWWAVCARMSVVL